MSEEQKGHVFAGFVDLASADLGGEAQYATDDFFAEKENLTNPKDAIFIPEKMTERGKWMDGWESRRRRLPGHDYCIVKLGAAGQIAGVDIDTAHFLGNHPPYGSLDACSVPDDTPIETLRDEVKWTEILPASPLQLGAHNLYPVASKERWTHVRLHMYPAGGIARLRVYGEVKPEAERFSKGALDLLALENGGKALACSDMFFSPMDNLLSPKAPQSMLDGWETRRRRIGGHDWVVLRLGQPGTVERLQVDTHFFNGNYPDACSAEGIYWPDAPLPDLLASPDWSPLMPPQKLQANAEHQFHQEHGLEVQKPITHLRLAILPDGGLSRVRAHGYAVPLEKPFQEAHPALEAINGASAEERQSLVMRCCGSTRFAQAMAKEGPFVSMAALMGAAERIWWRLSETDYLESFTHHPQIGASREELAKRFPDTQDLSGQEQAKVTHAPGEVLDRLAEKNKDYLDRFGFIFIVCATGKTAQEMLALLEERLKNTREQEIYYAAGEQAKITRLRLAQLKTEA